MKRYFYLFIAIITLSIFFSPYHVYAKTESTNLKEVVAEEIELFGNAGGYDETVKNLKEVDLSNYEENDKKVNVYLFRGNTCSHCFDAVVYFANMVAEYGEYFNFKSYEVWNNQDNNELMNEVAKKLGDEVSGVPYIVIGQKSWGGFADSYGEEIKSVIKEQYEKDSKDRYDVLKNIASNDGSGNTASDIVSIIIILLVVGGITLGIIMMRKKVSE